MSEAAIRFGQGGQLRRMTAVGWGEPERCFALLCGAHLVLWTLLPTLLTRNLLLDFTENLTWGQYWEWGYAKHPPLAPWLSALVIPLGGGDPWPLYLLSQLCVVLCFWAVWRLAREFTDPRRALLAVLLLEPICFYNFHTPEFNPNFLQLPLWALTVLSFWLAQRHQDLRLWAACGIAAGLSLLAKYYAGALLLTLALLLLGTPHGRRLLRTPGPYLALGCALLVVAPHVAWTVRSDFLPFRYMLQRADGAGGPFTHLVYPLAFLRDSAGVLMPAALLFWFSLGRPAAPRPPDTDPFARAFLLAVGLGPFVLTLVLSLAFGWRINRMWATPLWSYTGLLAVLWLRPELSRLAGRRLALGLLVVTTLLAGLYVAVPRKRGRFPGDRLAAVVTQAWREQSGTPLRYVLGNWWAGGNVAHYSPDHPAVYNGSPGECPWMNPTALRAHGGVAVWDDSPEGHAARDAIFRQFPHAQPQPSLVLPSRSAAAPAAMVHWALVRPAAAPSPAARPSPGQ